MAHKKSGGSGKNGRNSPGQRLGVKAFGSESVTRILPGANVRRAKDDTLFALVDGTVKFERVSKDKRRVAVVPTA